MIDNLTCLIMSKKIVFGVLLSLLFGILGAKASVGGFPVYRGLPYKVEAHDDGTWWWTTTANDKIVCKINGKKLEEGRLAIFGDAKIFGLEFWGFGFSSDVFAEVKISQGDIAQRTSEKAKIQFSNGKEIQGDVIVTGYADMQRAFYFSLPNTNNQEYLLAMLASYDVKKVIIGGNVMEYQTLTKDTFAAMLNEWHEKFFGKDFKPTYSGGD